MYGNFPVGDWQSISTRNYIQALQYQVEVGSFTALPCVLVP